MPDTGVARPPTTPPRTLRAPFPYFGGKTRVAAAVWQRFGAVPNYVEACFGSGAILLSRPHEPKLETVNDADGFVANFWRALQHAPEEVAEWANWPVSEPDLHARHLWLVAHRAEHLERLMSDPDYYDAKVAGWWVWGISQWIGKGWCHYAHWKPRPHLGTSGNGLTRQLPALYQRGGIHRLDQQGVTVEWMRRLQARLRYVRVCCGNWDRVLGPSVTYKCNGTDSLTGVFLDPPYDPAERDSRLYAVDGAVAREIAAWAIANGDNPLLRIALCGYDGEHEMPPSWSVLRWKASGGYANQGEIGNKARANASREVVWFSPACLNPQRMLPLFDDAPVTEDLDDDPE